MPGRSSKTLGHSPRGGRRGAVQYWTDPGPETLLGWAGVSQRPLCLPEAYFSNLRKLS
jgi:hypothetical protein